MLKAGKLRHRVVIQKPVRTQDQQSGAYITTWVDDRTVWASIQPISAREFVASQVEDSKVTTRITIRYAQDLDHTCRLYHASKDVYYNIEGILSDKNSGLEYLTLPCSEGLRDQVVDEVIPVNLELPSIQGVPTIGSNVTAVNGIWANDPESYIYQWYVDDIALTGETESTLVIPNLPQTVLTLGVVAINMAGESEEAISEGVIIP